MLAATLLPVFLPLALCEYLVLDVARKVPQSYPRLARRQEDLNVVIDQSSDKLEYTINVTIGTPPQDMGVTLDTGSSTLWVPAVSSKPCKQGLCDLGSFNPSDSSTYDIIDQGGFNASYAGAGDYDAGNWVEESVSVGGSKTLNGTIVGISLEGFDHHGVMGVGFDTNEAQPNPGKDNVYPSILDVMVQQGVINREAFSLYLNDVNDTTGSICFGCVDSTKYSGDLIALPLQASTPEEEGGNGTVREFMVTLTSIVFTDSTGATTSLTPDGYAQAALLDSGTTQTLLAADVLAAALQGFGAVDVGNENFAVPCAYANSNASLTYTFGGQGGPSIVVPMSHLIDPLPYSGTFDDASGACDIGLGAIASTGSVILGDTFLRSAYIVLDITNEQAAIAQASEEKADTSSIQVISSGTAIPGVSSTATATGTQLTGALASSTPAVATPSVSDGTTILGSPTFSLGASATSSGAKASNAVTSSNVAVATKGPGSVLLGAGLVAGAMLL